MLLQLDTSNDLTGGCAQLRLKRHNHHENIMMGAALEEVHQIPATGHATPSLLAIYRWIATINKGWASDTQRN
jgi:hypothetical protein